MAPQRLKPRCVEEVKIEDIDFEAVQECSDKNFLKRYIKILEEDGGYFQELLKACKDKLLEVAPKEYYILYPRVASEREVDEAMRDLLDWESVVKETDAALRSSKKGPLSADDACHRTAAPIRGQEPVVARANLQKPEGGPASRGPRNDRDAYARDKTRMKDYYRAWDSFDVDKMEEELDAEEREEAEARRVHFEGLKEEQDEANRGSAIRVDGLPDGVPEAHRKYLADCEKEKGNEAFYSKDYEEAEAYYSRSLHFRADDPSSWANRALARLKLSQPVGALQDCEHALALNARYMKALHRKGKALYELGRYEEAVRSFQLALQESPGNSQINGDLMVARRRLRSDGPAPPPERPRRVDDPPSCTVEELPDDDVAAPPAPPAPPPAAGYTRVQIDEDSDSESDDGVQIEEVKAAPAANADSSGRAFRKVVIEEMAYGVFNPGYGAQPQLLAPAPYGAVQPILMHPSQASAAETVKWAAFHRGEATTDTEVNSSISDRSSSLSSGGKRVGAPLFGGALDAAVPSFKDAARRVRLGRGLAPERSTFSALGLDTVRKPREAPACRRGPAVDTKEWLSTEVAARRAAAVPAGGKPGHKSHACGSSDRTSAPNSDAEVSDCSPSSFVSPTATDAESISNKPVQPLGLGPSARPAAMQPDETTASMAAARGFLLGYRSLARPDTSLKLRAVLVPHSPEIQPSNLWHGLSSPAAKSLSRQEMLNSPLGRQSSQTLPTPTGKAYRVRAYSSDHIGNFGRNVRSLLNKVCPENVASVAEKVSQVKIQTAEELQLMIQLLFKKALAEPHYCETYADLVFALKSAFQEFPSPEGGKPVTFRSSLLNTVQGEFEDLQAAGTSAEASVDRQELEQARKSRALANMKFIGHLFLRHLLPVRVVSSLARALLLCDEAASMPSDVAVECACELLMAVGYTMEASALPIARQALAEACARLSSLKREGGYCKRIQFVIQDVLDTRGAGWTRKLFKSSAKTMEEVRLDQQRDLSSQGASSSGVERVVAGQRPNYLAACT